MQLVYGSYTHDENEVFLSSRLESLYSDNQVKIGYKETWTINGRLQGSSQSDLTSKINTLRTAYLTDGRDLKLKDNSGADTALVILNNNTTSGVKIREFNMPDLSGAQYTTYVDYSIIADAEVISQASSPYDSYQDSISITGNGGPKVVVLETANGVPIQQTVKQRTKVVAVQSGSASSRSGIPPYPQFLFPAYVMQEQINKQHTITEQNGSIVNIITWNYVYESPSTLSSYARLP